MLKSTKPNLRVKHPYSYLFNSILLGIIMLFTGIFSVLALNTFKPHPDVQAETTNTATVYYQTKETDNTVYMWTTGGSSDFALNVFTGHFGSQIGVQNNSSKMDETKLIIDYGANSIFFNSTDSIRMNAYYQGQDENDVESTTDGSCGCTNGDCECPECSDSPSSCVCDADSHCDCWVWDSTGEYEYVDYVYQLNDDGYRDNAYYIISSASVYDVRNGKLGYYVKISGDNYYGTNVIMDYNLPEGYTTLSSVDSTKTAVFTDPNHFATADNPIGFKTLLLYVNSDKKGMSSWCNYENSLQAYISGPSISYKNGGTIEQAGTINTATVYCQTEETNNVHFYNDTVNISNMSSGHNWTHGYLGVVTPESTIAKTEIIVDYGINNIVFNQDLGFAFRAYLISKQYDPSGNTIQFTSNVSLNGSAHENDAYVIFSSASPQQVRNGDYEYYIKIGGDYKNGSNSVLGYNLPDGFTTLSSVDSSKTPVLYNANSFNSVNNPVKFRTMYIYANSSQYSNISSSSTCKNDLNVYQGWAKSVIYTYGGNFNRLNPLETPTTFGPTDKGTVTGDGTSGLSGRTIVGDGTANYPYQIYNWNDFEFLRKYIELMNGNNDLHFTFMGDTAITSKTFKFYGYVDNTWTYMQDYDIGGNFEGTLHGNGHVISINASDYSKPIFDTLSGSALIRDITIKINNGNSASNYNSGAIDSLNTWNDSVLARIIKSTTAGDIILENINIDLGSYFVMSKTADWTARDSIFNTSSNQYYIDAGILLKEAYLGASGSNLTVANCNVSGDIKLYWDVGGTSKSFGVFTGFYDSVPGSKTSYLNNTYDGTIAMFKSFTGGLTTNTTMGSHVSGIIGDVDKGYGITIDGNNINTTFYFSAKENTSSYGYSNSSSSSLYLSHIAFFWGSSANTVVMKNNVINKDKKLSYALSADSDNNLSLGASANIKLFDGISRYSTNLGTFTMSNNYSSIASGANGKVSNYGDTHYTYTTGSATYGFTDYMPGSATNLEENSSRFSYPAGWYKDSSNYNYYRVGVNVLNLSTKDGNYTTVTPVNNVYNISNAKELNYISKLSNSVSAGKTYGETFKGKIINITADIDMLGYNWVPLQYFEGTLLGNGHKITNLYIDAPTSTAGQPGNAKDSAYNMSIGFISIIDGTIKGLTIDNSYILASDMIQNPNGYVDKQIQVSTLGAVNCYTNTIKLYSNYVYNSGIHLLSHKNIYGSYPDSTTIDGYSANALNWVFGSNTTIYGQAVGAVLDGYGFTQIDVSAGLSGTGARSNLTSNFASSISSQAVLKNKLVFGDYGYINTIVNSNATDLVIQNVTAQTATVTSVDKRILNFADLTDSGGKLTGYSTLSSFLAKILTGDYADIWGIYLENDTSSSVIEQIKNGTSISLTPTTSGTCSHTNKTNTTDGGVTKAWSILWGIW